MHACLTIACSRSKAKGQVGKWFVCPTFLAPSAWVKDIGIGEVVMQTAHSVQGD